MIDEDVVWQAFRDQAASTIGASLSQINNLPAIIRPDYMTGVKPTPLPPEYPYLVIKLTILDIVSQSELISTVDDNNYTTLKRLERYLVTFNCYGPKSQSIINSLHFSFNIDSARDTIRTSTGGAIRSLSDPLTSSSQFSERFVETSEFNLVWVSANELLDNNSTVIDTVDLTLT